MKKMTTTESNKLIDLFMVEFMEHESDKADALFHLNRGCEPRKFNEYWDLLISAVKQCKSIWDEYDFDSYEYQTIESDIFDLDNTLSEFMSNDIEGIYERVVQFVQWYNENQEPVMGSFDEKGDLI